eukprot:gene33073-40815_t
MGYGVDPSDLLQSEEDPTSPFDHSSEDEDIPIEYPSLVIKVVAGVWLAYAASYLIMKNYSTCSAGYYLVMGVIYPLLIVVIVWGFRYLRAQQVEEPESIVSGDVLWNESSYHLPVAAFFIGILTTMLGIGGGELHVPTHDRLWLLHLLRPEISEAPHDDHDEQRINDAHDFFW